MKFFFTNRLFGANRRGLVKGPATVTGTKHLLDNGEFAEVTSTGIAASQSETDAGTEAAKYVAPLTLHGYVNPPLALRAPRARMGSDGGTSDRGLIAQFGAHGNVAGSACTFVTSPFVLPASGDCAIFSVQQANSTFGSSSTGFGARIVSGTLRVEQWESFTAVARRREVAGFQTTYGGRTIVLVVRVPEGDSTTPPLIYVLGAELASIAGATGGGGVNYLAASMSTSYFLSARTWPASDNAPVAHLINYDVGADEALRLSRGEPFAGVDVCGGSMNPANTDPYLAAGTSGYTLNNATGGATVSDTKNTTSPIYGSADYKVEVTVAGSSNDYPRVRLNGFTFDKPGRKRIRLWYQRVSGTQTTARFHYYFTGAAPYETLPNYDGTVQYAEWETEYTSASATSTPMIPIDGRSVCEFRFVCEITQLGLLDLPIIQPALATGDATRQGMSRRMLGMYPINYDIGAAPKTIPVRSQDYTAATSVQILGGPLTNAKQRLVSVRGNSSASVNLSLGTTSGGTQLVNAQAVNGDFDISTFASRIIASGASLYLTFSGNTTASVKITLEDL